MVDWSDVSALSGVVLLVLAPPFFLLSSLLLHLHRSRHPISDRSPLLVLALNATLLTSAVLLLLFLSLHSPTSPLCVLPLLSLCFSLLFAPLLLLLRSAVLLFRLELTRELEQFAPEEEEQQQQVEQRGARAATTTAWPSPRRAGGTAGEEGGEEQPTPSAAALRDERVKEAAEEEGNTGAEEEAAPPGLWWVEHRWLISLPFRCLTFLPLFALAGVGLLLVLLRQPSDAATTSCGLSSASSLSVHGVGLLLFLAHSALLCLSSHRHPSAYGLRAEAALTTTTVLLTLPLCLSLTSASPTASSFLLLSLQLLLPLASTLLPLSFSHTFSLHSSSLAELSSLRSFDDLIRNPLGYDSFLAYLKTEFSEENLAFWGEVEELRGKLRELGQVEAALQERREKEERERAAKEEEEERQAKAGGGVGGEVKVMRPSASSSAATASASFGASSDPSTTPPMAKGSPRSSERLHSPTTVDAVSGWREAVPASASLSLPQVHAPQSKAKVKAGIGLGPVTVAIVTRGRRGSSAGELTSASLSSPPQLPSTVNVRASDSIPPPLPGSTGASFSPFTRPHQLSDDLSSSPPTQLPPPTFLPFPLDDSWSVDALAKLRRVSWSIALDRKVQRHRAESRSQLRDSTTALQRPSSALHRPSTAQQRPGGASPRQQPSPRPLAVRALTVSTNSQSATPTAAAAASASASAVQPSTTAPTALTVEVSPRAPASLTTVAASPMAAAAAAKAPFMQSIVRALQATKLASNKRVEREDGAVKRLSEERASLHAWLLNKACEVVDRYIAPGSASQVNLPDVLVQRVMERMREVNPVKYGGGAKPRTRGRQHSQHGMQTTLGLMRHATMHFFATQHHHLHMGKVNPFADRLRAKEEQDRIDAHRAKVLDEANRVRDLSALSFPLSELFHDAQVAIQQLMEKDSFKRYLTSAAFDHFCSTYAQRRMREGGMGGLVSAAVVAREVSRTIVGVLTPRLSGREVEGGDDKGRHLMVGPSLLERRGSDSLLRLQGRPSPRAQRSHSFHAVESQRRPSIGLSSHVPPASVPLPLPAIPPSPSASLVVPPSPASHPHALWSDLRKLTLPSTPTRPHSGSVLLQSQLGRGRASSSKPATSMGPSSTASPTGQQRSLAMVGEGVGMSSTPGSSRTRRAPSTSVSPRGIREESEGEFDGE